MSTTQVPAIGPVVPAYQMGALPEDPQLLRVLYGQDAARATTNPDFQRGATAPDEAGEEDEVGVTLLVAVDKYLADRFSRHEIARTTMGGYRSKLQRMARHLRDKPVDKVTTADIERWTAAAGKTLDPATLYVNMATATSFFKWCVRQGLIRSNPMEGVPRPRLPRRLPRNLQKNAVRRAVDAAGDDLRDRVAILLGVQCGLRCLEVAGLEVGDIDMSERTMRVIGKGNKERILPIPDEAWEAIGALLLDTPMSSGPLLRSRRHPNRGISASYVSDLISAVMKRAGLTETAHSLRHTCATDVLRTSKNVRTVQVMLGHASLQSTERYLGIANLTELRTAMEGRSYS